MKKLLALILMVALALSLISCGGEANSPTTIPEETQTVEVTEPQETEEVEQPTGEISEPSAEPAPSKEASPTEEPSASNGEKKSILFDEDGNTVSMEDFIHEYQLSLSLFSMIANGKFYTVEKPEDSSISYYLYEHEGANSTAVQTETSLSFSNSDNSDDFVGPDGIFNKIILMSTFYLDNEDALMLHMIAASELMYSIDPSNNESTYLDLVNQSMQSSSKSSDGTFSFRKNNITYTFTYTNVGNNLCMFGVGAEF